MYISCTKNNVFKELIKMYLNVFLSFYVLYINTSENVRYESKSGTNTKLNSWFADKKNYLCAVSVLSYDIFMV